MFRYDTSECKDQVKVNLQGHIDKNIAGMIDDLMPYLIDFNSIKLDFAKVRLIDSSGLGLLMFLVLALKERKCDVEIVNLPEQLRENIKKVNLPEVLGDEVFSDIKM